MEENVKEEKFNVQFEYFNSIFVNKFEKNSLTIFSQKKNNTKKLLISLENIGEKGKIFLIMF